MSNINTPQKTPGQLHLADEMNVQTNWTNSPGLQLGTFSPSMVFNSQGNHLDYVATSDIVFTASSIVAFNVRKVKITTDGTHTFSVGGGVRLISGSLGLIDAGTYDFIFGSFDASEVLLSVPGIAQQPTPTLTTPTLSAVPQSQAITINWSNEDPAQTGRELLRSTTDNISTASPVVGYDGTASYLDDNDGAGLVNGTTYYYWGRNTASGYNPSGYGTTNSTPGTVQLTQPTNLVATTGQDSSVPLTWDSIDANADNVSVERSLTSGSGFSQLILLAQSATSHDDTTAVNDTQYFYRIIAKGSGNYSDSDPSAEESATPGAAIWSLNSLELDPDYIYNVISQGNSALTTLADTPNLNAKDLPITLSAWIKPKDTVPEQTIICYEEGSNTGITRQYTLLIRPNNDPTYPSHARVLLYDAAGAYLILNSTNPISTSVWTHILVTSDGTAPATGMSSIKLYLNGVEDAGIPLVSGTFANYPTSDANWRLRLGMARTGQSYWAGNLNNVAVHSKVLNQTEVTEQYNSGKPLDLRTLSNATELELFMHLESGITDLSTNTYVFDEYSGFNPDGIPQFVADAP